MIRNQDGIALVITLLVVALLTITVVEFTYSVEVDQSMTRNALNGLQATLLARSGINLGEAFLLHDTPPNLDKFDSYTEDWGQLDELNSQFVLPDNMRLRVQILDESGKLNINMTRPQNVAEWNQVRQAQATQPPAGAQAPVLRPFQSWMEAFGQLVQGHGGDPQAIDALGAYWDQIWAAVASGQFGVAPTAQGTPTPQSQPTMNLNQTVAPVLIDFPSLDDAAIVPGLTPSVIRSIRSAVTALPAGRQPRVNINTAPREVLAAIIQAGDVVDNIISQRQQQGLQDTDLTQLLAPLAANPATRNARSMLGVKSAYFLIRASAVINPNPVTGRGGISRSASMLVWRYATTGVGRPGPAGQPHWTLTQLDWQKEGGAALFQKADADGATQDPSIPSFPEG